MGWMGSAGQADGAAFGGGQRQFNAEVERQRQDGRTGGDRVPAFRSADAARPEERDGLDYWPKSKGLALQDFPSLARLSVAYDDAERRVRAATIFADTLRARAEVGARP